MVIVAVKIAERPRVNCETNNTEAEASSCLAVPHPMKALSLSLRAFAACRAFALGFTAASPRLAGQSAAAPEPGAWTTAQDHANMLEQLGIAKLRPGASGRTGPEVAKPANYDAAKASPKLLQAGAELLDTAIRSGETRQLAQLGQAVELLAGLDPRRLRNACGYADWWNAQRVFTGIFQRIFRFLHLSLSRRPHLICGTRKQTSLPLTGFTFSSRPERHRAMG